MNRLSSVGITAWSWVSALGRAHSESPGTSFQSSFFGAGLSSHEAELGIPGYSGRYPGQLPPLPREHRYRESRCARLLLEALRPLEASLARVKARVQSDRIAIILGSSTGGIDATELALRHERLTGHFPADYRFRDVHPYDSLLHLLQGLLGLTGPSVIVSTACSSGGKALGCAQRLLHSGVIDAALVGGADALCEMTIRGFSGLGVLSEGPCRPFEVGRDGISIGEGAALLLLEADSHAPIHLLGVGESSDAYHATAPHPEGVGAVLAMQNCLSIAGITPEDVDYLNAHGTGTEKNDAMEALAISKVLGEDLLFSSTKHKTGHQLGTAGATEAIVCVQAIAEGGLSPDLMQNRENPSAWDPDLAVFPVHSLQKSRLDVALSNSFAFGGSNVTVAVGRRPRNSVARTTSRPCFVEGMALWTPNYACLADFRAGRRVSQGEKPPADILSARARGRASVLSRAFAEVYAGLEPPRDLGAPMSPARIPSVYASCFGEMQTTLKLLDQMDDEPRLSPIRFQASVHNTASGLISLETKNRAFTTALAAGDATFAMALLEAQAWLCCHGGEILVLVADEKLPARLDHQLRFPPLSVGLRLSATQTGRSLASLDFVGTSSSAELGTSDAQRKRLDEFATAPPVWGLSLLSALDENHRGEIVVGPHFSTRIGQLSARE